MAAKSKTVSLGERERTEIERSRREAENQTPDDLLAVSAPSNVRRYIDPPATTHHALEYAFHLLGDLNAKRVLDFGCGMGENSALLAHRGAEVLSMDISHDLCRVTRNRMDVHRFQGRVFVSSAHHVSLPDEAVDVVFGAAVLHHLDIRLASGEIWRVLKRGGHAVFEEPLRDSKVLNMAHRVLLVKPPPLVSPYEKPLRLKDIEVFRSRFAIETCRFFALPFSRLGGPLGIHSKRLRKMEDWAQGKLPYLHRYATGVVVKLVKC